MEKTTEALDKTFSLLIEGATTKGAELVDFVYNQAPDVIQQLLTWKLCESLIYCICGLIIVIGIPIIIWKLIKFLWVKLDIENSCNEGPFIVLIGVISAATLLITQSIGWGMVNITWFKIWMAPKVYMLEYLSTLIK